jgi:hypothetical protein
MHMMEHSQEPRERGRRRRAASQYLEDVWGLKYAPATLAQMAVSGRGPVYRLVGKFVEYLDADLDAFARSKIGDPRRKASEPAVIPAARGGKAA